MITSAGPRAVPDPRRADATTDPIPATPGTTAEHLALAAAHVARNYDPLPVVLATGEGAWVTDVEGARYLDCLGAYSAVTFGHRHPALVAAAAAQLERLTVTGRAFLADQLAPFCAELSALVGKQRVLPMNTGAEAVETAIKLARRWGYEVKGVAADTATVVVAREAFHGRTTTIVSLSTDPEVRAGFGPYTPGFRAVPYGDADALAEAVDATTVAVLLEPVQGEAGVVVPPTDYLPRVREVCDRAGALLVDDEVQAGLARTGRTLACEHTGVVPDVVLLGKALGGGILPVSAVCADADVLDVLAAGSHGSTFGGNPLACAVGRAVVRLLASGEPQERARDLGAHLADLLHPLVGDGLTAVRGLGLWAGLDVDPACGSARRVCERLAERGVLAKEAHGRTLRLAPPVVVEPAELEWAVEQLRAALTASRSG